MMASSGNVYEYANGVLRNNYHIRDAATLASVEATVTGLRIIQLAQTLLPGNFDLDHLKAIHFFIFQDIYAWAGQLRTVDIGKGAGQFAHYGFLINNANPLFARLRQESLLQGLSSLQFIPRIAYYFGEVNALHPFCEGNGRTQRMFFFFLAKLAGFSLDWQRISANQMIDASEASLLRADNQGFEQIFTTTLSERNP